MGNSMKITAFLFTLIAVLFLNHSGAQIMPLTNEAAKLCQEKQYRPALEKISEAKLSAEESADPYMWYVDGFIHKEIYKQEEMGNRNSSHRELAGESFLKSLEMDVHGTNTAMTKLSLKFLASSYYNDALLQTQDFDLATQDEPEKLYTKFKRFMHYAEPGTSMRKFDSEFKKSMGQRYFALWQMDIDNDFPADRAADYYAEVVRIDSTASDAYYNIAVVYYNRAVFKYRKIGPDTDIFDLIVIQQECADLIKNKALPNMEHAYKLTPEKGDVVRGLMYIHRALEHENDVEYFKNEIERLVKEGKIVIPEK